jgi:hypothetical protein
MNSAVRLKHRKQFEAIFGKCRLAALVHEMRLMSQ